MRPAKTWPSVLLIAGIASVPIIEAGRLRDASSREGAARVSTNALLDDLLAVERLRATQHSVGQHAPSEQDVLSLVNHALAEAGVPSRHFDSLRPEGDTSVPGRRDVRRRTMRLALKEIAVPDLGLFLGALTEENHGWTIESIELTHMPSRRSQADAWTATMVLGAPYAVGGVP